MNLSVAAAIHYVTARDKVRLNFRALVSLLINFSSIEIVDAFLLSDIANGVLCLDWLYSCFCIVVTFTEQAVNYNENDDGGQAATAKFFGAPARDDGSEKVVHELGVYR